MKKSIIILSFLNAFSFCFGQSFEAEQKQVGTTWSSAWGMHALEDVFVVGGIAYFDSLEYQHMFMATYGYDGDMMHFDTIPEIDYILALNVNNNMVLKNDLVYWMSIGSGRTIIYSYDYKINHFNAIDTFDTYLLDFSSRDFMILGDDEFLFTGAFRTGNGQFDFGIIQYKNGSIIDLFRGVDLDGIENGKRIFENNNTYTILCEVNEDGNKDSKLYNLDEDLNLISSRGEDSGLLKVHFGQQISDEEGHFVYSSLKADLDRREYKPIITKISKEGNVLWEKIIGRYEHGFDPSSEWKGIIESNQNDGYVIAGSAYIDARQRDTLLGYAVISKLSSDGDSIWYRKFTTLDTSRAYHVFTDVVSNPNGGYIAIGYDQYLTSTTPEGKPRFNIIMVRLDENGLPLSTSTTNSVIINEGIDVQVYPNPCINQVYISSESSVPLSCKIVDVSGRILQSFDIKDKAETYVLNTENLSTGLYYLHCMRDGEYLSKKLIVVK